MGGTAQFGSDPAADGLIGLHQILPSQYFDHSGGHRLTGEQRLMLALLADAINVYQQGVQSRSTRKRLLFVDAERWIMAQIPNRHAFSFDLVCDSLGINAAVLRRRMVAWKHQSRQSSETPSLASHFRLKITPRAKGLSHRRPRSRTSTIAI